VLLGERERDRVELGVPQLHQVGAEARAMDDLCAEPLIELRRSDDTGGDQQLP
jgi:hypothetical protein